MANRPKQIGVRGPLADRLWARVDKRPDGCWIWTGYTHPTRGYGQLSRGGRAAGLIETHRAAWEVTHGPIPEGLVVRHRCDVRACVNPGHLELGTQADNIQDAVKRGRIARGRRLPQSRLTEADVREIRRRYVRRYERTAAGQMRSNGAELCEEFGISQPHLSGIVNGKEWKWVA